MQIKRDRQPIAGRDRHQIRRVGYLLGYENVQVRSTRKMRRQHLKSKFFILTKKDVAVLQSLIIIRKLVENLQIVGS